MRGMRSCRYCDVRNNLKVGVINCSLNMIVYDCTITLWGTTHVRKLHDLFGFL